MSRILVDQVRSNSASGDAITLDGNGKCAINATTINSLTFPTSDGSADQLLKTNGSGALSFGTVSAGITMAQQWRLTSSSQGNQTPLTAWEAVDNGAPGSIGSAMSVSSGIFTYPSTGIYLILFTLSGYSDNHTQNVIGTINHTVNNGSNWITCGSGFDGIYDFNNSYPSWGDTFIMHMVDITDLSNHKTRFVYGAGQGGEYVHGNSDYSYTTVTFIRLGAT